MSFIYSEQIVRPPARIRRRAGALALTGSREMGLRTVFDFGPRQETIVVDGIRIQQVLINLMRNAMDAMLLTMSRV